MNTREHNPGLDLLKIVATFMVIGVHFCGGISYFSIQPFTPNWLWLHFFSAVCYSCVDIYAMISGYVHAGNRGRIKRAVSLWLCVLFYSVLSRYLQFLEEGAFSCKSTLMALCPFVMGRYWYFNAYVGLLFFAPYLCAGLEQLSLVQARKFVFTALGFALLCWLCGPTPAGKWLGAYEGYSALWLAIIYCLGFFIRKYGDSLFFDSGAISKKHCFCIFLFSAFGVLMSNAAIHIIGQWAFGKPIGVHFFNSYLSPFVILEAVSFLLLFEKLGPSLRHTGTINVLKYVSSLTFGIYIAHATPYFASFWPLIKKCFYRFSGNILSAPCLFFIGICAIFILCALIEAARRIIFQTLKIDDSVYCLIAKVFHFQVPAGR